MGRPDVVAIHQTGKCRRDCGKGRFVIDTVLNNTRLTELIPAEEVRKKFKVVNEGFGKRAVPYYILLVVLVLGSGLGLYVGLTFDDLKGVRCTKITRVCSVEEEDPNFETCNKFWCCPGLHALPFTFRDTHPDKYPEVCTPVNHTHIIKDNHHQSWSIAGVCKTRTWVSGCLEENHKVRIQGKEGNFESRVAPRSVILFTGICYLTCLVNIVLSCFFFYRIFVQTRFIKESFED